MTLTAPVAVHTPVPRRRPDPLAIAVGMTVVLLPFLSPAGPGNSALGDVCMVGAVILALLWVARERLPLHVPYAPGVALLVVGGATAAIVARAPSSVALVLAEDLVLLAWACTLALGRHRPALVRTATVAWCRMAPLYCVVMVIAYLTGIDALSGVSGNDGVRASYTFGDPNLAGNYLVVSLFMMAACRRPRTPWVRHAGYLVVLTAVLFTGSNGAMLTLVLGSVACWVLSRAQLGAAKGVSALVVSALIAITVAVWVIPNVSLDGIRNATAGSVPLLRDSVGRSGNSTAERGSILSEGFALFLDGDTTGYGPARTKATLRSDQAPYVKEAHNDYLATLLERGVIGSVGLVLLIVAIALRCTVLAGRAPLPPELASLVPRPWLLVAIAPVMATAAAFYEVLHFRHLWTWLGIVAALALALQDARRTAPERDTTS